MFIMLDIIMIILLHKSLFTSWMIARFLEVDLSGKNK